MQDPINRKLGKYEIIGELGKGGFATVYRARDVDLEREVALKVLDPLLTRDPVWVARFRREARAVANLDHPRIVTVYDVGQAEGLVYIAIKLVEGGSLAQRIAQQGALSWNDVVTTTSQAAEALDFAHARGVLHRDLKPANILLDPRNGALLSDFGFARLVADNSMSMSLSGGVVGTPAYIAPEIWEGEEPKPQADVYALGCIVFELVTGKTLFTGSSTPAVMRAHFQPIKLPDQWPEGAPAGLAEVLQTALAKDPAARYERAGELAEALASLSKDALAAPYAQLQAAVQAGQWQQALQLSGQIRTINPKYRDVIALEQTALAGLQRETQTRQAAAWRQEAENALAEGDRKGAELALQKWQQLTPNNPAAVQFSVKLKEAQATPQAPARTPAAQEPASPETTLPAPKPQTEAPTQSGATSQHTLPPPKRGQSKLGLAIGAVALAAIALWAVVYLFGRGGSPTEAPVELPTTAPTEQPTTTPAAAVQSVGASAEGATSAGLTCLADAYNGKMKGTVVTMNGPFVDEEAVKFASSVKAFEEATGIDIQYEGSKEFEASITVRMQADDAPDIVDFPQPGLLATFVNQGKVVPATDMVPEEWLKENYLKSWLDMATIKGPNGPKQYGVWHRYNSKSLVWYPKDNFEAAGYTVPTTWEELLALQDQIVSDGNTPWCVGIESGAATGWPATDWTEEFMLRTTSLENYDKWITGELPFSSPEVKKAIETFAGIWNDDKMVNGGTAAIVTTSFADSPIPMFENPPKCWLHKQGNWITAFFPPHVQYGTDYGVFYFPGVDEDYGKPFLVAGDIMAAFDNRPEICAVMQYFSTGEGIRGWLEAGGTLGPQRDVQLDWYGNDLERDITNLVNDATSVRFDASDLMPGEVGAGSFWEGMTDYFSGAKDLDTVLRDIDASWPPRQ